MEMIEMVSVARNAQFQDFRDSPLAIASSTSCYISLREHWLEIFSFRRLPIFQKNNTSIGEVK